MSDRTSDRRAARQLPRLLALVASGTLGLGLLGIPAAAATGPIAGAAAVTQGGRYGDLTGDGVPEIVLPDSAGNLRAIRNTTETAETGQLFGAAVDSPTGTWQGVQTTHHGKLVGSGFQDDLIAHAAGATQLYLYRPSTSGITSRTAFYLNGTTTQGPVSCLDAGGATIACPPELGTDWSNATQVVAIGSVNNEPADLPVRTNLVAVIGTKLWLFTPGSTTARPLAATDRLLSGLDWSGYDLIGPGPANGTTTCTDAAGTTTTTAQATLWARERSTGRILAYPITRNPAANCAVDFSALADPAQGTVLGSGIDPAAHPVVGSVGDLNGDGTPDLYGANAAGEVTVWPGLVGDPTGHPGAVTGFGAPLA
ncbi:hypothetical protein [Kitasatospora sp. NPDC004531]